MSTAKPEEILGKLPKTTPAWAVGTVSVIVAFATSLGAVYLVGKSEVEKWVETSAKSAETKAQQEGQTFQVVLSLIRDNSQQITNLSSANLKLAERVSVIELELAGTKRSLSECQSALTKCGAK